VILKKNQTIEFLKKNTTFLLVGAIALIIFNKYILMIATFILLGTLSLLTIKISRIVPHISIESVSASSILIGYIWGWKFGLGFGLAIGFYGYAKEGLLKLKSIINVLLMGLGGVIASIFFSLSYSFLLAYMLCFVIRLILNNLIFPLVESDVFENMIHGFGDPIFNMLITFQIMNLVYTVLKLFM